MIIYYKIVTQLWDYNVNIEITFFVQSTFYNEGKNRDIETRNQLISADWQRFEYPANKLRRIKTKKHQANDSL